MKRIRLMLAVWFCIAAVSCSVPGEFHPKNSFNINFTPPNNTQVRGAFVFIVDGVNAEIFKQMLEAGELPAIKKYFVDRGLYVEKAVANVPSITLANLPSIATGKFPGNHGVTGINWFDRQKIFWRDYATIAQKNTLDGDYPQTKTIFELLPGEMTASLFCQAHRGASVFYENRLSAGPAFFFGKYKLVDRISLSRFSKLMKLSRKKKKFPLLVYNYTLCPDFYAYKYGSESEKYKQALIHTDRQIGRVLADAKRAGILDKIFIAFISDHSMGPVKGHFPMTKFLRSAGLAVATQRKSDRENETARQKYFARYNAISCTCGDRYTALYFRKPNWKVAPARYPNVDSQKPVPLALLDAERPFFDWPIRPSVADLRHYPLYAQPENSAERFFADTQVALRSYKGARTKLRSKGVPVYSGNLFDILVAQPAVDAIAWSVGKNRCCVRTKLGTAEIAQPGGQGKPIVYTVIAGRDPLGYGVPRVGARKLRRSPREWLSKTIDTNYPGILPGLVAYFRAPRAGDIAVFASPGWDFYSKNNAGHGGIRGYDDMCVPLIIAGPGIKRQQRKTAYTVDLPATILQLLGKKVPADMDGKPLLPAR